MQLVRSSRGPWILFWAGAAAGIVLLSCAVAQAVSFAVAHAADPAIARSAGTAAGGVFLVGWLMLGGLLAGGAIGRIRGAAMLLVSIGTFAISCGFDGTGGGASWPLAPVGRAGLWLGAGVAIGAAIAWSIASAAEAPAAMTLRQRVAGWGVGLTTHLSWLILLVALLAATMLYVHASRRILFWDPMVYWGKVDAVAAMIRHGVALADIRTLLGSAGDEYSMLPAIIPGVIVSPLPDHSLITYLLAIAACYVVPAMIAIGALGLALVGLVAPQLGRTSLGQRTDIVIISAVAAVSLLPIFLQVFLADAMLDIGGVVLAVLLTFIWSRLLKLVHGVGNAAPGWHHDRDVLSAAVMVTVLSILLFVFRRWYVFYALGLAGAGFCSIVLFRPWRQRRARSLFRDLGLASGAAAVAGICTGSDILVRWIVQWSNRQYAESYSAYWFGWGAEYAHFRDRFGIAVPLIAVLVVIAILMRGRQKELPFLLLLGSAFAMIGFYRVQGMGAHHAYLLMPLLAGGLCCGMILLTARVGVGPILVLLPLVAWGQALAPRAGPVLALIQPAAVMLKPRHDVDAPEVVRLGFWLSANLRADQHYCVVGSSPLLNDSLVAGAWQADRRLLDQPVQTQSVRLPDVDTRNGPPDGHIRDCTIMLVGDPVQTHLDPANQQSVVLTARDVLEATGIGRAYDAMAVSFPLPSGVIIRAFRQKREITASEIRALRRRFYLSKGDEASRYIERFGPP